MTPNIYTPSGVLFEEDLVSELPSETSMQPKEKPKYKLEIVWRNVIIFGYLHLASLYGLYLALTSAKLLTTLFGNNKYLDG